MLRFWWYVDQGCCCCCCCCLSLVEGLSSSRVSPTDSLTLQSSMHFYMHVTPLHRGFEPTMPFHTAYPHVLLCGLAWHLGAVVRLSRDNLSYFSVHCTPFYIADFQSARCYKGQPFRPAQLPHGEPAWHKLVVIHAFNMHNSISLFVQQMALICVSELIST